MNSGFARLRDADLRGSAHDYDRENVERRLSGRDFWKVIMTLLINEEQVAQLLDINAAIDAVEEVLRDQAEGSATNRPRYRVATPYSQLHVMSAGDKRLGIYGLKTYTVSKTGARF